MRNTSIAENIAAGRRELGITQAALAERVGVTKAAVSKWELGQTGARIVARADLRC